MIKVGYTWLTERYALKIRPLLHSSLIGPKMVRRERADGIVEEYYIRSYHPGNLPRYFQQGVPPNCAPRGG